MFQEVTRLTQLQPLLFSWRRYQFIFRLSLAWQDYWYVGIDPSWTKMHINGKNKGITSANAEFRIMRNMNAEEVTRF